MPIPQNSILDSFTRADETLDHGNWAGPISLTAGGALKLISNQAGSLLAGAPTAESYWNTTFGVNQEVFATMAVKPLDGELMTLVARLTDPDPSVDTEDFYGIQISPAAGTDDVSLTVVTNESQTTLASTAIEVSSGDKFWLSCVRDDIRGYRDTGSGYTLILSAVDSTHRNAGYLGAVVRQTTGRWDDFGGGDVVDLPQIYRRL